MSSLFFRIGKKSSGRGEEGREKLKSGNAEKLKS
jgi:hypothetical protein